MTSKKFEEALKILDVVEGGYVNDPQDPGKATKYGITQGTYNNYRKMQKQPLKDVKFLTRDEAKEIYYKEYWLKSGAEDYKDPKFALAVFDGEVNHGPNVNKKLKNKSGNNLKKYLDARKEEYKLDKNYNRYGEGWLNRLAYIEEKADSYEEAVNKGALPDKYTLYTKSDQIKKVSQNSILKQLKTNNDETLQRYQDILYESMLKSAANKGKESKTETKITGKTLKNMLDTQYQKLKDYTNKIYMESDAINKRFTGNIPKDYKNPHLENDRIFTKEEIDKMPRSEYQKNEKAIRYQRKTIGIPTKSQAEKTASKKGSGMVHVSGYTTSDGRKVGDYFRSYPRG